MIDNKRIDDLCDRIKSLDVSEQVELVKSDRGFLFALAHSLPPGASEEADTIVNLDASDPNVFQKVQLMLTATLLSSLERIEDLLEQKNKQEST